MRLEWYVPLPGVLELNFAQNSSMESCGDCFFVFFGGAGVVGGGRDAVEEEEEEEGELERRGIVSRFWKGLTRKVGRGGCLTQSRDLQ